MHNHLVYSEVLQQLLNQGPLVLMVSKEKFGASDVSGWSITRHRHLFAHRTPKFASCRVHLSLVLIQAQMSGSLCHSQGLRHGGYIIVTRILQVNEPFLPTNHAFALLKKQKLDRFSLCLMLESVLYRLWKNTLLHCLPAERNQCLITKTTLNN